MKIGEAIKQIRLQKGFNQGEFAKICSISQTYLSQIENGRKLPNFNVIEYISSKCDIPIPIVLFLSLQESDVKDDKKEIFNLLKPLLIDIIGKIFLNKQP